MPPFSPSFIGCVIIVAVIYFIIFGSYSCWKLTKTYNISRNDNITKSNIQLWHFCVFVIMFGYYRFRFSFMLIFCEIISRFFIWLKMCMTNPLPACLCPVYCSKYIYIYRYIYLQGVSISIMYLKFVCMQLLYPLILTKSWGNPPV